MSNPNFKLSGASGSFTYTDDQEKALTEMVDWSHKSKNTLTLYGAAGTGKTTVLKDFIKENKYKAGVAVTAPTHKAVRIASQLTNLKGVTIQKLLGLRPNTNLEDFNINSPVFMPRARKAIANFSLVIIDECSMVNRSLFGLIIGEAIRNKVKILFVGDPYQLPPIRENISPTFTDVDVKIKLEQIVRQSGDNPVLKLLEAARNDVKHGTFKLIDFISKDPIQFNDDGEGYMAASKEDFKNFMIKAFSSDEYSKNIDFAKFCAFTNNNILAWNEFVRQSIYKEAKDNIILKDDLITAYATLLDEFQSQIIVNSEDYIIDDIQSYRNQSNISGFVVRFKKVFGGQYTPYMFIVDTSDYQNTLRFLGIINNLILQAKSAPASQRSRKWEQYYSFKNNHLLISSLFDDGGKLIVKKDLDYGYCLTVHKTQGSTYKHVFVNAKNIIYNKYNRPYVDKVLMSKLLYVAISRATDTVTLYI